jgi:hypothetical protein
MNACQQREVARIAMHGEVLGADYMARGLSALGLPQRDARVVSSARFWRSRWLTLAWFRRPIGLQ